MPAGVILNSLIIIDGEHNTTSPCSHDIKCLNVIDLRAVSKAHFADATGAKGAATDSRSMSGMTGGI